MESATKPKHSRISQRRLSDDQVQQLRKLRGMGLTYKQLGELFGISAPGAYFIASGVIYSETHPSPNEDQRAVKRVEAARRNARNRARRNLSPVAPAPNETEGEGT